MDYQKRNTEKTLNPNNCLSQLCFFCTMKEPASLKRRAQIANYFEQMPRGDHQENVLVLSGLFHMAMSNPDDPEFPSLGIFECMASLIHKGVKDEEWLHRDQNIYVPYYAAHIIGSYTMNKAEFAEKAVQAGIVSPLMELLRGTMTWIEQRVAVRALGHVASYESTFEALAPYEDEVIRLCMNLASSCVDAVYDTFVGIDDTKNRAIYQCDLLTRGVGGLEMENLKAEEWTSQLQCWSLYLLNCFAYKERSLNLICDEGFLKNLCSMWGGLANQVSPSGVGLVRILCYSKYGRKKICEVKEVIESLCHLSRSSDDWQYMGIDCLLLLLKDQDTRFKVFETAVLFLVDLVELRDLGDRSNLGDTIAKVLLQDYNKKVSNVKLINNDGKVHKALEYLWDVKVERRRKERLISEEKLEERRVLIKMIKQQANRLYCLGDIDGASRKYSEAIGLCPFKLRRERMVLYSNRSRCQLLLEDPDSAIRDSTRALCLSSPANSHSKSLWRRSQAYDMKGLAKESLMDCVVFINGYNNTTTKIPYYAARMISKQMDATWLFAAARSTKAQKGSNRVINMMDKKGVSTIKMEPLIVTEEMDRARRVPKRVHAVKKPTITSELGFLPNNAVGADMLQRSGIGLKS